MTEPDYHVSLLRVTGEDGERAVLACADHRGQEALSLSDGWLEDCAPVPSVILDCSGAVQLTNYQDVSAMAAWLSAAAVWLQIQQLEEGTL
jgi:hypothetical protein